MKSNAPTMKNRAFPRNIINPLTRLAVIPCLDAGDKGEKEDDDNGGDIGEVHICHMCVERELR